MKRQMVAMAMADRVQHDVETSWLFDLVRRKGEENADACATLAHALGSFADYALSDWHRSALKTILQNLVEEIAASIRDQVVLVAERLGAAPPAIPDEFFQQYDGAVMEMLVRNGFYESPALVEAAAHRLCQEQLERAHRLERAQGGGISNTLADILLLQTPSVAANALSRYQAQKALYIDGFDNPVLPCTALDTAAMGDLVWRVAAALRIVCRSERPVGMAQIDGLIDAAATAVAGSLNAPDDCAAGQLASVLVQEARLGEEALVDLFGTGETPLAEAWIAARANLRPVLVRRLLYEAGGDRLAVLARFIGFSSDGLSLIYRMTRPGGAGLFFAEGQGEGDPLALFEKIDAKDACRIVQYWSLSSDYSRALTALTRD
tara:strand:- start:285 stop:1418 length:1134 start_codon:yes stop_codon:yes gene_type:complete